MVVARPITAEYLLVKVVYVCVRDGFVVHSRGYLHQNQVRTNEHNERAAARYCLEIDEFIKRERSETEFCIIGSRLATSDIQAL